MLLGAQKWGAPALSAAVVVCQPDHLLMGAQKWGAPVFSFILWTEPGLSSVVMFADLPRSGYTLRCARRGSWTSLRSWQLDRCARGSWTLLRSWQLVPELWGELQPFIKLLDSSRFFLGLSGFERGS